MPLKYRSLSARVKLSTVTGTTSAAAAAGAGETGAGAGGVAALPPILFSGGAFQVPFRASGLGQYRRVAIRNGPAGAGSQLDSRSAPGFSCWMWIVTPPSASRFSVGSMDELIR